MSVHVNIQAAAGLNMSVSSLVQPLNGLSPFLETPRQFATVSFGHVDLNVWITAAGDEDFELREQFNALHDAWQKERNDLSSFSEEIAMCPSYQQIIALGRKVVPLILQELVKSAEPDHWFWALSALARENPVPYESRGKLHEMANAWLQWGIRKSYISGQGLGIRVS